MNLKYKLPPKANRYLVNVSEYIGFYINYRDDLPAGSLIKNKININNWFGLFFIKKKSLFQNEIFNRPHGIKIIIWTWNTKNLFTHVTR